MAKSNEGGTHNPMWLGIGLIAGVVLGSIIDNMGLGIALGLIYGSAMYVVVKRGNVEEESKEKDSSEESSE